MLDADLAVLYEVPTKALNQAVKRNERRFPPDFMFRLTKKEKGELVTNCDRFERLKHSSALPRAFTEQGVSMLSSVLKSDRAIDVNVEIMRAFVRLRQLMATHTDLARKLTALEQKYRQLLATHTDLARKLTASEQKYDEQFKIVFDAIRALMSPPEKPRKKIGFVVKEKQAAYGSLEGTCGTAICKSVVGLGC
jgi:hypothetical protein